MSTQESTYAPKSPDLSSFYSSATSDIPQHPNAPGGYPFQAGLQAGLGAGIGAGPGGSLRYNQPQPHQYSTYQSPAPPPAPPTSAPAYGSSNNHNNNNNNANTTTSTSTTTTTAFSPYSPQGAGAQQAQYYSPRQQTQFLPTNQSAYTLQNPNVHVPYYSSYPESAPSATYHQLQAQPSQPPTSHPPAVSDEPKLEPDLQGAMPPRKIAPAAKQSDLDPSPVRTKFPTARIKRIMQADEEVGKVAQQTPIAVGKALELFMVQLVRKSAEVAREKNSKRITAPMLKQAIGSANEWDFLLDIVAKVGEEKEGGKSSGRPKVETDSDEEDAGEVKRKGRGGRKKKAPA